MEETTTVICVSEETVEQPTVEFLTTESIETINTLSETTSTVITTVEQITYEEHFDTMITISLIEIFITSAILGTLLVKSLWERFK